MSPEVKFRTREGHVAVLKEGDFLTLAYPAEITAPYGETFCIEIQIAFKYHDGVVEAQGFPEIIHRFIEPNEKTKEKQESIWK